MKKNLLLFLTIFYFQSGIAQNGFTTNNQDLENIYEHQSIASPQPTLFQDAKPYNRRDIASINESSIYIQNELSDIFTENRTQLSHKLPKWIYKHPEQFIGGQSSDFYLRINPCIELKMGRESESEKWNSNISRGFEISGNILKKFNIYTQLTENSNNPAEYIKEYSQGMGGQSQYNFVPSYTYWMDKPSRGFDFTNVIGHLEYNPSKYLSLMIGHDRNHYGYGYRSLLLGDNGAPYFQFKANAYFWKLHYQVLFTQFTGQYIRGADRLLPKKYGAFHLLSYKPNKKWELGLFEGIMFHRNDGFELSYLNPIIFYQRLEYSLGSPDNSMVGFQAKFQPNTQVQFYTQFLLDDINFSSMVKNDGWWANKNGLQLGAKIIDLANINKLDAQIEFNTVRPYTYSHHNNDKSDTVDNYTHYNQPLAHPFGANFIELFLKLSYPIAPKLQTSLKYDYSVRGLDMNGLNMGGNIFANTSTSGIKSDYDNTIAQGNQQKVHFISFQSQYEIFHNLYFDFDVFYRKANDELGTKNQENFGFTSGLRLNLRKRDLIF